MSRDETRRRHPRPALLGACALLAGAATLGPAGTVHAEPGAPSTCQGQPATMVVDQDWDAVGTEGRDVVVAVGSSRVRTLGGDDLVCVIGTRTGSNLFGVDAGDGDDVVDTTQKTGGYYGDVVLGAGADRFIGGAAHDGVTTDGPGSAEDDHVVTGSGDDSVATGTPGHPNGDTVDLGEGDDAVSPAGSALTGPPLAGGSGRNTLRIGTEGAYAVDNTTGSGTLDGRPWARWSGFDHFSLWKSPAGFTFTGSDRDESVGLYEEYQGQPRSIDLAGGDDALSVYSLTTNGDVYQGGPGADFLAVGSTGGSLAIDLGSGDLHLDRQAAAPAEGTAADFENVHALARTVVLTGSAGADGLSATGCRLTASGGRGSDSITRVTDWVFEHYTFDDCRSTMRAVFRGGRGRDDIRGSLGNDKLYGGRGRDEVDGWSGRDLCRAEKQERCER